MKNVSTLVHSKLKYASMNRNKVSSDFKPYTKVSADENFPFQRNDAGIILLGVLYLQYISPTTPWVTSEAYLSSYIILDSTSSHGDMDVFDDYHEV